MVNNTTIFIMLNENSRRKLGLLGIVNKETPTNITWMANEYSGTPAGSIYSQLLETACLFICNSNESNIDIISDDPYFIGERGLVVDINVNVKQLLKDILEQGVKITIRKSNAEERPGYAFLRMRAAVVQDSELGKIATEEVDYFKYEYEQLQSKQYEKELQEKKAFKERQKKMYTELKPEKQGKIQFDDNHNWCDCIGSEEDILNDYGEDIVDMHKDMLKRFPEHNMIKCMKCGSILHKQAYKGHCPNCYSDYSYYVWNDVTGCSKCGKSFVD